MCVIAILLTPYSRHGTSSSHMLQVSFKDNGLMTFGDIVQKLLNDPSSLLDFQVNVGATGSLTASVPGQAANIVSGTPTVGFHWNDVTQTTGPKISSVKIRIDGVTSANTVAAR